MPCRAAEDSSLALPGRIPGTARTTSHLPGRQRRERCISSCSPWFSSVDCRLALLLPRIQRPRYGNQLFSVPSSRWLSDPRLARVPRGLIQEGFLYTRRTMGRDSGVDDVVSPRTPRSVARRVVCLDRVATAHGAGRERR